VKQSAIILCISLLFHINCGRAEVRPNKQEVNSNHNNATSQTVEVDEQTALTLAREDAAKKYRTLAEYDTVVCKAEEEWYVIFEHKSQGYSGGIIEYVINKNSGVILKTRKILSSNSIEGKTDGRKLNLGAGLNKEEATRIAYRDAVTAYKSLERYSVTACELTQAWLVVYQLKDPGSVGGGPEYFIDKSTGAIIDKRYYQ